MGRVVVKDPTSTLISPLLAGHYSTFSSWVIVRSSVLTLFAPSVNNTKTMLSSVYILFAPLLLVAPAAAAPALSKDEAGCAIVTVTATETVWADSSRPTPAVVEAAPAVSPVVFSEKYAPAATQPAEARPDTAPRPNSTPNVSPNVDTPSIAPSVLKDPQVVPNVNTTTTTGGPNPLSHYRNALYFTNW